MFLRQVIAGLCTLLLGAAISAQRPAKHPTATIPPKPNSPAQDPYAREAAITELLETVYRYRADGTGTKTDTATIRVQSAEGVQALSVLRVPFLPSLQKIDFTTVRVHKPNGQIIDTPPGDAQEQLAPLTAAVPELSTLRYAVLGIRGLAVGDRLELTIRTTLLASQDPGQFWGADAFGQGRVILKRIVDLHVPAGKTVLISSPHLQPELTTTPEEKTYRWTGAQLRPTTATRAAAPIAPTIAWTTFTSWAEVGAWYKSILEPATAPSPDVKRQADQVVYGLRTPEARLEALYRYLATSIRAVDVPLQNKPFHPHTASEVLNAQLGDSADRAVLFTAMCRAEGLLAAPALIAPGQVLQQDAPSPEQFTQVITRVQTSAATLTWLNTATETAPFAALSRELRDRPALLIPAGSPASLERTAATLPFPAADTFDSRAELSAEGTLTAHVDLSLRGDAELRLRDAFHQTDESSWDRVTQLYLRSLNLSGTPSGTTVATLANPGVPLQVSFDLVRPLYGDWAAHRIVPLEPGLDLPYTDRAQPTEGDLELGAQRTASAHTRMALPAGWTATLPQPLHVATSFATLDKTCHLASTPQPTSLLCDRELHILQSTLPLEKWAAYLAFLDQAAASEPWIQLTPPGATVTTSISSAHGTGSIDAARKVAEAREALGRKDLTTAASSLEQAKALNPQQPMLWATEGFLAQAKGDPRTAEADYRHELSANPNQAGVSLQLAAMLQSENRNADALAILQKANTLDPGNAAVAQQLATALNTTDPAAAGTVLQQALKTTPDSLPLKLALGTTLVQHGSSAQGTALLKEVTGTSQDASELNDAAFALANAGLDLHTAELASLHALRLINSTPATPPAEGSNQAGLRQALQLTACWDTLGWTLFRQGSLSEAEIWLQAAWKDSFGSEAGQHLAQLLAKQGRREEASHIALLASQAERPELASLRADLRQALNQTSPGQQTPPKTSLVAARSIPVPRPVGFPAGTARFEVTRGEAPESTTARWISGDAALASATEALRQVNLHTIVPAQTSAHVVRAGLLRCPTAGACTFLLLPARAALVQ